MVKPVVHFGVPVPEVSLRIKSPKIHPQRQLSRRKPSPSCRRRLQERSRSWTWKWVNLWWICTVASAMSIWSFVQTVRQVIDSLVAQALHRDNAQAQGLWEKDWKSSMPRRQSWEPRLPAEGTEQEPSEVPGSRLDPLHAEFVSKQCSVKPSEHWVFVADDCGF